MQNWDILFLDAAGVNPWAKASADSVAAVPDARCRLHYEWAPNSGSAAFETALRKIASRVKPHLLLLALTEGSIHTAEAMMGSIHQLFPTAPVVAAVHECRLEYAMHLFAMGVADFVSAPLTSADVMPRIWRLLEDRITGGTQAPERIAGMRQLIGTSPRFLAEIHKIPRLAGCDANLVILGETGCGKELCARAVHHLSRRSNQPLIPINCGAIPVDLLENELFGHESGAYTGALTAQSGVVGEADGGTLFLDEVDCLPLAAQVKLLRFLQEKRYRPLGSPKYRNADVRVIAASNVDLLAATQQGKMRSDLYYRLNVLSMHLPPLRERREDIPELARHFVNKYVSEFRRSAMALSSGAMSLLLLHAWPGNVRELEHVIERAVALTSADMIEECDILLDQASGQTPAKSFQEAKARAVIEFEKSYIQGVLASTSGNISKASRRANKNRRAFWELIRKHHIDVQALRA